MLTLSHVSKSYGKFPAVEDISLEMEHGLYGMLAPNGAGKTTFIKMIATLLVPTQGEILWDGIPVAKLGEKYRDLLGYLPQQFGYYKNNTPVQYLDYLAALKNMPKQTAKEKIEQLLELVGLSDVADKKMKKFSGGMIQRVGIAQAMLNDPKILILDEPTAGLDPKERARFRNIVAQQAVRRGAQRIGQPHQCGQADARGAGFDVAHVRGRDPGRLGKLFLRPAQPNPRDFDPATDLHIIQFHLFARFP